MVSFLYNKKTSRLSKKDLFWLLFSLLLLAATVTGIIWYFHDRSLQKEEAKRQAEEVKKEEAEIAAWVEEQKKSGMSEENMPKSERGNEDEDNIFPLLPPPPPASMQLMKTKGCVADGFLSGYGGDINSSIALINRSQCYYLHRALETWMKPPDFELAREIQEKVTKPNTVYGMFIAEAIDTHKDYHFPAEDRDFDFDEMCRKGSKNFWGEHSCKPSLEEEEYRKYIRYITEEAMNMGVQSFLFGQVFYQDASDLEKSVMPEVIKEMREYAEFRGMEIVIGAQTNDITDEKYLRMFDYIEGGVGLAGDGSVENGPCFSRWWNKPGDWCWALLWHPQFASKANNVFLHFDWSGKLGDDMSVFTRMSKDTRAETLERLHKKFTQSGEGFLMPLLATLHKENNGCHGPKERFYSASRKYSCQDEEVINKILEKQ